MAILLTVSYSSKPIDFYYMMAEPNYKDTINVYLKSNSCVASFVVVLANPATAKFKIDHEYNKLKSLLPSLVKPWHPSSLIVVLEDLVTNYYVTTVSLTPEHKRKLKLRADWKRAEEADKPVIDEFLDSPQFQDGKLMMIL